MSEGLLTGVNSEMSLLRWVSTQLRWTHTTPRLHAALPGSVTEEEDRVLNELLANSVWMKFGLTDLLTGFCDELVKAAGILARGMGIRRELLPFFVQISIQLLSTPESG